MTRGIHPAGPGAARRGGGTGRQAIVEPSGRLSSTSQPFQPDITPMNRPADPTRYGTTSRFLHWAIALLLLGEYALGVCRAFWASLSAIRIRQSEQPKKMIANHEPLCCR